MPKLSVLTHWYSIFADSFGIPCGMQVCQSTKHYNEWIKEWGLRVCVCVFTIVLTYNLVLESLSLVLVSCDVNGGSNWVPIGGVQEHCYALGKVSLKLGFNSPQQ